jgi:hypothetical protein
MWHSGFTKPLIRELAAGPAKARVNMRTAVNWRLKQYRVLALETVPAGECHPRWGATWYCLT